MECSCRNRSHLQDTGNVRRLTNDMYVSRFIVCWYYTSTTTGWTRTFVSSYWFRPLRDAGRLSAVFFVNLFFWRLNIKIATEFIVLALPASSANHPVLSLSGAQRCSWEWRHVGRGEETPSGVYMKTSPVPVSPSGVRYWPVVRNSWRERGRDMWWTFSTHSLNPVEMEEATEISHFPIKYSDV